MNQTNCSIRVKVAPSHSFHPNCSLSAQRKGYVAGINR